MSNRLQQFRSEFARKAPRQRLYGRREHVEKILGALQRANRGQGALLLLPGVSGSGKTTLAELLREPTIEGNGYFLAGKFNQYDQNAPFVAWRQALVNFCECVCREDEANRIQLSEKILDAVGDNGQLLVDLVPEFESVIGKQAPIASISPFEARHRFASVIRALLNVISSAEHPLVLFLDDWQWADAASLNLLSELNVGSTLRYLLLVAAYRCDEVDASHPLTEKLTYLETQNIPMEVIEIENLSLGELSDLVSDASLVDHSGVGELAREIHTLTEGNPFFVHALLGLYHQQGAEVDCGISSFLHSKTELNAGVVEIFSEKFAQLDPENQQLISFAACIGNRFDLETLALINGSSAEHCEGKLLTLTPDFVRPIGINAEGENEAGIQWYQFVHDRVQQAAYGAISDAEMPKVRLGIGRKLLAQLSAELVAERVCEVVEHLNFCTDLIDSTDERIRSIELNVAAARKAKQATAFRSAFQYHIAAQQFLQDPATARELWQNHHNLAMTLYRDHAETEFLEGDPKTAHQFIRIAVEHASSPVEKAESLNLLIVQYTLQAKYSDAIGAGREALEALGILLPNEHYEAARDAEIAKTHCLLKGRSFRELAKQPEASDAKMRAAARVLITMGPPCYRSHQSLWSVIVPKVVNITLGYGNIPQIGYSHTAFTGLLGWVGNDYSLGKQFTELACEVMNGALATPSDKAVFHLMIGSSARHWFQHLADSSEDYAQAYRVGVQSGNLQYAAYAFGHNMYCRYFQGAELPDVIAESLASLEFSKTRHNQWAIDLLEGGMHLFGQAVGAECFDCGSTPWEAAYLARVRKHHNQQVECIYRVLKANLCLIMGDYEAAMKLSDSAVPLVPMVGTQGLLPWAEHVFARFMSLASGIDEQESSGKVTSELVELHELQEQIAIWAEHCSENFEHKYLLANAEIARIEGRYTDAAERYQKAIESARHEGFVQWEGLANERASLLWRAIGDHRLEHLYWQQAFYCFDRWGANAKLRRMANEFTAGSGQHRVAGTELGRAAGSVSLPDAKFVDRIFDKHLQLLRQQSRDLTAFQEKRGEASQIDELANVADVLRSDIAKRRRSSEELRRKWDAERDLNEELERRVQERTLELSKAESRFRKVLESAPIAMVMVDTRGVIQLVNSAMEELFGYPRGELIGKSVVTLFSAETKKRLQSVGNDLRRGLHELMESEGFESRCVRQSGCDFPIQLGLNEVATDEGVFMLGAILDVTVQRDTLIAMRTAKEEAESANRAKSAFLANMSHEIRTPMNGIMGTCELAFKTDLDPEQKMYLMTMQRSAAALLDIINDILDFSKIEAGKIHLEDKPFSLHELVNDVIQLLTPNSRAKQISLNCDLDSRLNRSFQGDAGRLRQVLFNLVGNALKFTNKGSVRLSIDLVKRQDSFATIQFELQDTGIGIARDKVGIIFDPFSQIELDDNRRFGGTGLGLSISSRLVRLMGGELAVESELGRGTKFSFSLVLPEAAPCENRQAEVLKTEPTRRSLNVLVAEDNRANQLVATCLLKKRGHRVFVASNGAIAVQQFQQERFDLILMDVQMPEMDGLEATRRIRASEKMSGTNTPIIAVTAGAMQGDRDRCLEAGMDEFLSKPIDWKKLDAFLDRLLSPAPIVSGGQALRLDLGNQQTNITRQQSTIEEAVGATLGNLQVMMAQIAEPILTGNTFGLDKSNDHLSGATQAVSMAWKADCSAAVESACSGGRQSDHGADS
ncbi:MAG: AAA family ATPase [Planctomycetaceae bacterium]|nr:AAA family ATPase [Planctomycetaceae bacterium]